MTVVTPEKTVAGPPIQTAKEVADADGLNAFIFAFPKVGKTTFGASAQDSPYGKDVLFLDCAGDAGIRSISHRDDIGVIRIMEWEQLGKMYDYLWKGEHSYNTIVLDPITSAQDLARMQVSESSKTPLAPSWDDWNKINWMTLTMLRDYKNLASAKGWNVLFMDWCKEEMDDLGRILYRPTINPAIQMKIGGAVDLIGYMSIDQQGNRVIDFEPKFLQITGKRESPVDAKIPPKLIAPQSEGPTMVELLELVKGKKQQKGTSK